MANIKVKLRLPAPTGAQGTVYYLIGHEQRVKRITSDHRLYPNEWDAKLSTVIVPAKGERRVTLLSIRAAIEKDIERLKRIIDLMQTTRHTFTVDDIADEFRSYRDRYSLFNYMKGLIGTLMQKGRIRTSETYRATLNSFSTFTAGTDIMLDEITPTIMESYQAWLGRRGVTPNTISFYTRILRATYNRAVDSGITPNANPFRHTYTGIDKTIKRALPLSAIRRIRKLDLKPSTRLDYARDMFMLSFFMRGMSFIDMAYRRKTDLSNGYITYRRRKTGQLLTIKWTGEMQSILDKYPENLSKYLLPIIRTSTINERYAYLNTGYSINYNLKKVAQLAAIDIPLTLYVARHSWASAAKSKNIPLSVISEGMGHNSELTTRIYLAALDTSVIDRANAKIISSI